MRPHSAPALPTAADEHYRRLVRMHPYGIFVIDRGGRFTEANPALGTLLGRPVEDILDRHFLDMFPPEERKRLAGYFQERMDGYAAERDYHARFRLPDGALRVAHIRTVPILEEDVVAGIHGVVRDVTEEQRAEAELRAARTRLSATLERISDAFISADHALRVTYANSRAARLLERDPEELLDRPLQRRIPASLWPGLAAACQRALATQVADQLEAYVAEWRRWFEIRVHPSPEGLSIFVRDVTERWQADAERHRREREFQALLENVPDIVVRFDRELRHVYVSPSVEREVGIPPEAWIGKTHREMAMPADVAEQWTRALRRALAQGEEEWIEFELPTPAGRRLYECRITPERGPDGEVASLLAVGRDVTAHRRFEAALQDSEARFRSLVEQSLAGTYILRQGRFAYVNPYCAEIFGYSPEEMTAGLGLLDLIAPEDRPLIRDVLDARLAGERSDARHPLRGVRRDGQPVELEAHVTRTEIAGEPVLIGMLLDITERVRAEAALREREEQLRHAQKLEAVGQLSGGIAHDFNNLLMVVQGIANLMLMDPSLSPSQRPDLQQILRAAERATTLTRQLLAFSRKQVLRPKVFQLNAAIEELQRLVHRVIGADVELVSVLAPDAGHVRADPGQIEQVVLNLVVNARDAMPGGGRLTVSTAAVELSPGDTRRFPYRVLPGPYVRLALQDTGHGMDEGTLARIFEPFFTTKEPGKGTGLGLSTVYGIVKQSGGYIWAESRVGEGTTFEVYLPRVEFAADAPAPAPPAAPISRGSGTVLLVEDEAPVREVARRLLEHGGYTVVEAASGREALQRFDQHPTPIDLLITDVVMPEMGGRELAMHLQARCGTTRVLYISGYADSREVRRELGERESDFIQKPFPPELLLERVGRALAGAPRSPAAPGAPAR